MNEPWFPVAVVLLLALLVGFAVPALLQLRKTLLSAQTFLDTTGKELDVVLREAGEAARRINGLTAEIGQNVGKIRESMESLKDVVDSARRLRDTLRSISGVALALGPAIFAAIQAFLARSSDRGRSASDAAPSESPTQAAPTPAAEENRP